MGVAASLNCGSGGPPLDDDDEVFTAFGRRREGGSAHCGYVHRCAGRGGGKGGKFMYAVGCWTTERCYVHQPCTAVHAFMFAHTEAKGP